MKNKLISLELEQRVTERAESELKSLVEGAFQRLEYDMPLLMESAEWCRFSIKMKGRLITQMRGRFVQTAIDRACGQITRMERQIKAALR